MFLPDLAAAFREARRVLTHGGVFRFSVWDSGGDVGALVREAERRLAGEFGSASTTTRVQALFYRALAR